MSVIDLECIKSDYSNECGNCGVSRGQLLHLGECNGENFAIGLFFHLPPFGCPKQIKRARLFLFKIPHETYCGCHVNSENEYCVYPLLDFSISSCSFQAPQFDKNLYVKFRDKYCASYTEIDITKLIIAWASETIDNKGILIQGCNGTLITYASTRHKDLGMRPFVRISYEENQTLVSVPCLVNVL